MDALGEALDGALTRLAEVAHRGLRHVTPAAYAGVEEAVRALTAIGLRTSADAVSAFLTAHKSGDAETTTRAWMDAQIHLTTCAELR